MASTGAVEQVPKGPCAVRETEVGSPRLPPAVTASELSDTIEIRDARSLRHYRVRWVWPPTYRGSRPWQGLRDDIRAGGIRAPLVILEDGQVIDGGHRLDLARELGVLSVPVRVAHLRLPLTDADRLRIEAFAVLDACARRQLTAQEIDVLLLDFLAGRDEIQAGQTRLANLKRGPESGQRTTLGPTLNELAAWTGLSARHIKRVARVARHGPPALRDQVRRGEVAIRGAEEAIRGSNPESVAKEKHEAYLTMDRGLEAFCARVDAAVTAALGWPREGREALIGVLWRITKDLEDLAALLDLPQPETIHAGR